MNDAFVNKVYSDGDKDIYLPFWRKIVQAEMTQNKHIKSEEIQERIQTIQEDEIALKHPKTGATFKLCDDGAIEIFVNEDTGVRMDPKDNAIVFYGDVIHLGTKETRIHTKPYGLIWNNHNMNPYLYYGEKVEGQRHIPRVTTTSKDSEGKVISTKNIPIFQEQKRKQYYDPKVKEFVSRIGIEHPSIRRGGAK